MILFFIPDWLTGFNFLVGLLTLLVLIAGSAIIVFSRRTVEVSTLQVDRATALEGLLKIKETELEALKITYTAANEELEDLTAEHRTLAGLRIEELMSHWGQKEELEAKVQDLERQIRVLKKRKDGDI